MSALDFHGEEAGNHSVYDLNKHNIDDNFGEDTYVKEIFSFDLLFAQVIGQKHEYRLRAGNLREYVPNA